MTKLMKSQSGFTLVELLAVLIIVAILAAIGTPIYMEYVKSARASEAQTAISSIVTGNKVYYQKHGKYAAFDELVNKKAVQIDEATMDKWKFSIDKSDTELKEIKAISTEEMPGGAGMEIKYTVKNGKFSGYGCD